MPEPPGVGFVVLGETVQKREDMIRGYLINRFDPGREMLWMADIRAK